MSDRPTCSCPHRPVSASTAARSAEASESASCPICGGDPLAGRSFPISLAGQRPTEFNWSGPRARPEPPGDGDSVSIAIDPGARPPQPEKVFRPRWQTAAPRGRSVQSREVQRRVCRFLGTAVGLWGVFSLIPGAVAWEHWLGNVSVTPLPLWLPANLVLASLPLLLGLLLFLIPDWISLQAVAGGLLAMTSGYGFAASLFGLAKPDSVWLSTLGFPLSEAKRATVWCLAMAILAGLLSFGCFRESQRWRRVAELLSQLPPSG